MDPILETLNRLATKKARKTERRPPAPAPKVTPPSRSPEPPPAPPPSSPELEADLPRNWRALVRGRWPVPFEEEWEERAAIIEFEGGLSRALAERKAYEDMMNRHEGLERFERELRSHEEDPRIRLLTKLFDPRLMAVWWSER